jgi:hypothetical protein
LLSIAVLSIPSLPATPAVPAAPPQAPAASSSSDDPNSFAHYLKSIQGRQSDDSTTDAGTSPKFSAALKDKSGRDSTSNGSDKKKSTLLTDTVPVALSSTAPAQDPKAFQLSWLHSNGNAKTETKSSLQQSALPSQTTAKGLANEEDSSHATSDALTGKVAEAVSNAPVAFGATLSKQDVLRADGLKTGDAAKSGEGKTGEAASKPSSAQSAAAKPVAEIAKPSEGKNSSNNQQHSSDSSQDDQPPAAASGSFKAAAASAHADSAAPAIHAASTESAPQVSTGAAAVQNAYASATSTIKSAAPAPATAVTEPAPAPTVRPQNIDLKIAGADNSQIDVRVSQRAGDVQVTVRTPDGDLAQSLRQHLPELSDRLSQAGVSGNLWQPQTAQASNNGGNDADSRYSDDAQTQQQNQQQQSRHNNQGSRQQNSNTWNNELTQANKESK